MTTTAEQNPNSKVEGGWILEGQKRWIGNSTFADLLIIFARNTSTNQINGFIRVLMLKFFPKMETVLSQSYEHMVREAKAEAEEHNSSSAPEENLISQPQNKDGAEEDNEERVSVEEVGDCLCIQFR